MALGAVLDHDVGKACSHYCYGQRSCSSPKVIYSPGMIIDIADYGLVRLQGIEAIVSRLTSRNQCIPIARQHWVGNNRLGCSKLTPCPAQVVAIQLQVW